MRAAAPPTTTTVDRPRLDVWLAADRGITRHAAQTMIDAGLVIVNGRQAKASHRVRTHDEVRVLAASERPKPAVAGEITRVPSLASSINVIYEDEHLAVIDKPAGLVVHPAAGHHGDTLADALRARGDTWSLLGGEERAGIVHRLDRDTSGLLVVAKTEAAHRALAAQLHQRTLGRTYWAMVHGGFREDRGTIDAPIARHPRDRKRMAVVDTGRAAVTDFTVVERLGETSVLEVELRTGRTHQIRVHFAHIGHPVVGDAVYGREDGRLGRPALHAARLTFRHPSGGEITTFESPVPPDLLAFRDNQRRRRQ